MIKVSGIGGVSVFGLTLWWFCIVTVRRSEVCLLILREMTIVRVLSASMLPKHGVSFHSAGKC